MTLLFWRTLCGVYYYGQAVLPLSWIHSKIVSATTIRIIGLTKTAKIVFLLLDWIYCSIRIMTVLYTEHKPKKKNNGRTVKDVCIYVYMWTSYRRIVFLVWVGITSKATPNKFPVSRPPPASPSWSQFGPIIRLLMTSQTHKRQFMSLCDHAFRANGGHVVERNDLQPLLLQNAPAVDHLWGRQR